SPSAAVSAMRVGCAKVSAAFHAHDDGTWLAMAGKVVELLPDAIGRSTHERFLLGCPGGQTVLVENNTDVGRRVPLHVGERVGVDGQYIWNRLGGLIHDTHHSTSSTTPSGWIYAAGHVYQ